MADIYNIYIYMYVYSYMLHMYIVLEEQDDIYIINTIYLSRDTIYYRAYPFNNTWNGDY